MVPVLFPRGAHFRALTALTFLANQFVFQNFNKTLNWEGACLFFRPRFMWCLRGISIPRSAVQCTQQFQLYLSLTSPTFFQDTKGPVQDAMASDGNGRASSLPTSAERAPGSSASFFGRVVQFSLGLVGRVRVLSQRLHSTVSSIGHHVAQNPLDSFFMCQLLAFGVPFLYVQSEVLGQILGEFCGQPADQWELMSPNFELCNSFGFCGALWILCATWKSQYIILHCGFGA